MHEGTAWGTARADSARWDELLAGESPRAVREVERALDGLSPGGRLELLRSARPRHLKQLFELSRGEPVSASHFVPGLSEVVHDGVNSMPVFRIFQKRFFRAPEGWLAGYNPGPFNWCVTPGYFVVREEHGQLSFDYTELPPEVPKGWPRPIPNRRKLGRWVYYGLRDDMRRVSEHVSVGAVFRHGEPIETWFALCRRPTPLP